MAEGEALLRMQLGAGHGRCGGESPGARRRIVEAEDQAVQARARLLAALAARRVRVGYVDVAANSTHYSGVRSGFHSG